MTLKKENQYHKCNIIITVQ